MKATACVLLLCCALMLPAHASEPILWAIDAGPQWRDGESITISTDPLAASPATFPAGREFVMDAHYDRTSRLLYVSGGYISDPGWWIQNTIHLYSGGPEGLTFVSSSNAGMGDPTAGGYSWLGGIALLDDSLYALGLLEGIGGDVVLLRIDNPATPAQTVTQVGAALGDDLGSPYNLCPDEQGALFAMFGGVLYRIDPATASMTALRTYPGTFDGESVEGLTVAGGHLYASGFKYGKIIRFDLNTYEDTLLGEIPSGWTGLVTIPEPSLLGALGLGLAMCAAWLRKHRS